MDSETKKLFVGVGLAFSVAVSGILGYRSYDNVPKNSFAVRVKGGEVQKNLYTPGYYPKRPYLDTFYSFSNNTVVLSTVAGHGRNTKDQNDFAMAVRLHYKIKPDAGILSFHLDELSTGNGSALLTEQMSNSVDALVAQLSGEQAMSSPAELLKGFVPQFEMRLKQNNIAVEIDMIELLDTRMGTGYRRPVQLMVRPGQDVQSMAGPAAIVPVSPAAPK